MSDRRRATCLVWSGTAALILGLFQAGPCMGQAYEPTRPIDNQPALLARAMACMTRQFPRAVDRTYVPTFRVFADADGYITRPPVLLNPIEGNERAVVFARNARAALIRCQPLPVRVGPSNPSRSEFSRVIRFDPDVFASSGRSEEQPTSGNRTNIEEERRAAEIAGRKIDLRGLVLGMSRTDVLAQLADNLKARCKDFTGEGLSYTCNASMPPATYDVAFTVVAPQVLRSVVYSFMTTHDRQRVIEDITRCFGAPQSDRVPGAWATWSLSPTIKLHLRESSEKYDLVLDSDTIAQRDYEQVQRLRNAAPPPRF